MRYSMRNRYHPAHWKFVQAWLDSQERLTADASALADQLIGAKMSDVLAMSKVYQKQGWLSSPSVIARGLLDACLAARGL